MCNCPEPGKLDTSKKSQTAKKKFPSLKRDLEITKSILQRRSKSGDCVFDHICDLIKRIIDEDPPNVADYFDEYSRIVREEKFRMKENNLVAGYENPPNLPVARHVMDALKLSLYPEISHFGEEEEEKTTENEEPYYAPVSKDAMHLHFFWNLCGLGVEQEMYILSHSIEKFEKHTAIQNCRFWGKIFGLKKNYYVLEVDLTPKEITSRLDQMKVDMMEKARALKEEGDLTLHPHVPRPDLFPGSNWVHYPPEELAKMNIKQPELPKNYYKKAVDIPPELVGRGLNRKTYFVCNDPLDDWVELPIVTPKQIIISRLISKFMTGDLEAQVVSNPPFPGKEKHYLRAVISRITAGTHIAPAGYMKIGKAKSQTDEMAEDEEEEEEAEEEEDEEEDDAKKDNDQPTIENLKYKPPPVRNLFNFENWQHDRPAILTQGRVAAYDETKYRKELILDVVGEGDEEEDEETEDEDETDEEEGVQRKHDFETGPPLFTAISEDVVDLNIPSWSVRQSTQHNSKNMLVIMKSNVWPGAHSFAGKDIVDSLYVGWGVKYGKRNISPPPLPDIQEEYPIGPEILEIFDPSAQEEEDWRVAHTKVIVEHLGEPDNMEEEVEEEEKDGNEDD